MQGCIRGRWKMLKTKPFIINMNNEGFKMINILNMNEISKEQILAFANKAFPGKTVNLGDGRWWYIQAGTLMGEDLHYEYHNGKVHLHIEGPNWRPIRNYFDRVVNDPQIVTQHWWRQRCCLTLQRDLSSWEEIQDAFLEIDRIMRPHILSFERSQGVYQEVNENSVESDVDARKIKVSELMSQSYLNIPEYQRPYRWTFKNVEQLLTDINDARANGKQNFLIGSVILHKKVDKLDIVDGQQRITTLYLIAKALDYKGSLPQLTFNHTDSFFHIHENNAFIHEWVKLNLAKSDRQNFLDFIFDNCQVTEVIVKQLNEAFHLFETQNGRGKELEAYNLLKAYHIRAMTSSSRKEKIDCDVRWEDAAMYANKNNPPKDLLKQLINEHLYRSRLWSRREEAGRFSKQHVDEFKGLTIDRDTPIEFAYQNSLVQQQIASGLLQMMNVGLFKLKNRFDHGDPDNMSPFANINQLIVNGKPFFDWVETYIEIYKRIFMQPDSSQLSDFKDFYRSFCKYEGCQRNGDSYIREVYKSAIILIFDRFGEKGLNHLYKAVYICLYRMRLKKKQVRYATMSSYSSSGWIFAQINNAKNISDLSEIIRRASEYKKKTPKNFEVRKINELFDK